MFCAKAPLVNPTTQPMSTHAWNLVQAFLPEAFPFAENIADPHNDLRYRNDCQRLPQPSFPAQLPPVQAACASRAHPSYSYPYTLSNQIMGAPKPRRVSDVRYCKYESIWHP